MIRKIFIGCAVSGVLLSACGGGEQSSDSTAPVADTATVKLAEAEEEHEAQDDFISVALPSALQLARSLQRAGLTYVEELPNNPDKVDSYTTSLEKRMNFGVYSADFAYAILNGQSQAAINSMGALKKMSDNLGYPNAFEEGMVERIESNIGERDSMVNILAEIQFKNQKYIERNNMDTDANLIFAGAWLEGMYIGSKIADPNSAPDLVSQLGEQSLLIEDLVTMLQKMDCADCGPLVNDINQIYGHFEAKIVDGDIPDEFVFTMEEYAALQADISSIRRKYTNG